jgi:glyoxylase I family protein
MDWIQYLPTADVLDEGRLTRLGWLDPIGEEVMMNMGIPGLRRLDHVGFTVPDLEEATRFLVDVLGCEFLYPLGPFASDANWMTEHLNVHPRAVVRENRFFRCGDQAVFEVFDYSAPDRTSEMPRNSDVGGHHIALYVDDLDAAVAYLKSQGVTVCGEPTASKGPAAGNRWVYFLAPWGMQFELVSYPNGKAFDRATGSQDVA